MAHRADIKWLQRERRTRKEIGQKIRDERKRQGKRLVDVFEASGMSTSHISELENGRISSTVRTMKRVADSLGKPISFFMPDEVLPHSTIVRADEQEWGVGANGGWKSTLIEPGDSRLGSGLLHIMRDGFIPSDTLGNDVTQTEVIGIVTRGSVSVDRQMLNRGETFHFIGMNGTRAPSIRNAGTGEAEMVLVRLAQ